MTNKTFTSNEVLETLVAQVIELQNEYNEATDSISKAEITMEQKTIRKIAKKFGFGFNAFMSERKRQMDVIKEEAKTPKVNEAFDVKMYDEMVHALSMFSERVVWILGEQKMILEDGRTIEQYIYQIEGEYDNLISLKANIILL